MATVKTESKQSDVKSIQLPPSEGQWDPADIARPAEKAYAEGKAHTERAYGEGKAYADKAYEAWKRLLEDQYSQAARWEGYGMDQARMAVDQSLKFMTDSLAYAVQYNSDWQRIAFDWARRAALLVVPPA